MTRTRGPARRLAGELPDEVQQGRLAGAVGADVGTGVCGALGADVHNGTAVLAHPRPPRMLDEPQWRLDADGEAVTPAVGIDVHEGPVRLVRARVVDDEADPAELAQRHPGQRPQMRRVGHGPREPDTAERVGGPAPHSPDHVP